MMQILLVDTETQRQERLSVEFNDRWKALTADEKIRFVKRAINDCIKEKIQQAES